MTRITTNTANEANGLSKPSRSLGMTPRVDRIFGRCKA